MDRFQKRIADLELQIEKLRTEWKRASGEKKREIEIEASNKKSELRILKQVVKNRETKGL